MRSAWSFFFAFVFYSVSFATIPECGLEVAGSVIAPADYEILRRHGSTTLAYSQFQPGLSHFRTEEGLVAYQDKWGKRLVLGDPLAAAEAADRVLDQFLAHTPDPFFSAITYGTAAPLAQRGFLVNEMGRDIRIDIQAYTLDGPDKAKLRQARNKFVREKYQLHEDTAEEHLETAQAITQGWRQSKPVGDREVRFLTRPIHYGREQDVRKFYVQDAQGQIVAFFYFDPIYENGAVVGYSTSFKRRLPQAMTGMEEAVTTLAIDKFRAEGMRWLHLGMIPLYKLQDQEFRHSRSLRAALLGTVRYADGVVYSFSGHADFKHRFRGEEFPIYFATRHEWNFRPVFALLSSCELYCPPKQLASVLWSLGTSLVGSAVSRLEKP